MKDQVAISFRVDSEVYKEIKKAADNQSRSISNFCQQAIKEALKNVK